MSQTQHKVYYGPIQEMRGQTALVQEDTNHPDKWLAQFDRFNLMYKGVDLSHGWHLFDRKDFK